MKLENVTVRCRTFGGVLNENLVIPRGFQSESGEFLTQGFSLQKSVEIYSIKEIPWNGEAAERRVFVGGKRVDSFRHDFRDAESDAYQR